MACVTGQSLCASRRVFRSATSFRSDATSDWSCWLVANISSALFSSSWIHVFRFSRHLIAAALCEFQCMQHIYQDENYLYTHYTRDNGKLISTIPIEFQDFTVKWSFNHFIYADFLKKSANSEVLTTQVNFHILDDLFMYYVNTPKKNSVYTAEDDMITSICVTNIYHDCSS